MPLRAKQFFSGHEVAHVLDLGWNKLVNGLLLAAAADAGFEVFVTVDKSIQHQQNIARLPLPVMELDLLRNRQPDVKLAAPYFPAALEQVARFNFVSIDRNGRIETRAERP